MLWLMPVSGFDRYDDHLVGQPAGWSAGRCIGEIKKVVSGENITGHMGSSMPFEFERVGTMFISTTLLSQLTIT